MTAGPTTIEREAKFDVDEAYDPPDLRPLVGRTRRLPEQRLQTVYYDTPDRRLAQRGINLRYRTGEGEGTEGTGIWTLKLPESEAARILARQELTWRGEPGHIPAGAVSVLRGVVRRSVLGEVVQLDSRRRRLALHRTGAGRAWGELDDDLVTVVGGPEDGLRFRQVELELQPDPPAEAQAVLDSLRRSGAKPSGRPKLAMALGDATTPGDRARDKARRRETLSDTIRLSIQANLGRLLDYDYRLRRDGQRADPQDIHQARVAARRLRSDLRTFGSVIDPIWLRHVTDDLRWIGTALGAVRDVDVLSGQFRLGVDASNPTGTGTSGLLDRLAAQRSQAVAELSSALAADRYIDLLDKLHAATEAPPLLGGASRGAKNGGQKAESRSASALPAYVRRQWRRMPRQVRQGGTRPSDRQLHQMRIAAKRLRYAAEAAAPVIGKPAARTAKAAGRAQTVLGEFHDAVAAEQWLWAQVGDADLAPEAAFAAGTLSRAQQDRQRKLRRQWRSEWRELRRKKNRAWF